MRGLVSALCAVAVLRGASGLAGGGMGGAPDSAAAPRGDMVRAGSGSLRPRLLSPGTQAIRSFELDQGAETPTSRTTQTVEVAEFEGVEVYRIRTVHEAASDTTRTLTIVRRHDLALVRQEVRASRDSATAAVDDLHLAGWSVLPSRPVRELIRRTWRDK